MPHEGRTGVVIVAAGRGQRFGGDIPKQYNILQGVPVLRHTVARFLAVPAITVVQVVIHADDRVLYDAALEGVTDQRVLPVAVGGDTRSRTVYNGLKELDDQNLENVLIHDAARPFVSAEVIGRVMAALAEVEGAFAALPVVDALWRTANGKAVQPVARDALWRAQTPQGFRFDAILRAHETAEATATDDVAVAVAAGMQVRPVLGAAENYKITVAEDMARAVQTLSGEQA